MWGLGHAWQHQAAPLLEGSHVPAPASHLLPPASQNRKRRPSPVTSRPPTALVLSKGLLLARPCCSEEERERVGPSPDCPQSWMNGWDLGWVRDGKRTHQGQWSW